MRILRMFEIILLILLLGDKTNNAMARHFSKGDKCRLKAHEHILLNVVRNGLPKVHHPKHVIIVGAGIAGLTAGKLLKDAGYKITILEASDGVGGRIQTYRDPDNRYYVDLGAMRVSKSQKFTNALLDYFNISTSPCVDHDDNTWFYVNGKKIQTSVVDENPDILGFDVSPEEKGKSSSKLLGDAVKDVVNNCSKCGVLDRFCLMQYDHYSLKEYLFEVGGLSKTAITMTQVVKRESDYYQAFTEAIGWMAPSDVQYQYFEIVGGTDKLPKAFLPELEDDMVYNARVNRIEHDNETVVAYYTHSGKDIPVSSDYLITTATAKSTSFIRFVPDLDINKRQAIRNIRYKGATKIILVFQTPFWQEEGIRGGFTTTDLPVTKIDYPSHDFDSGLGVLIASYTGGDQSNTFLGLTDEECLLQALDNVAEIHGDHVKELYIEGIVKKWSLDPFSLGAFTNFAPYQLTDMWVPMVKPVGNLFFAGEHTHFPHGWMDTAIKSAVEAVHCISSNNCYTQL